MKNALLFSAAWAALGSACMGGFTNVGLVPAQEESQEQILERLYGGDFVRNGENFSNGLIDVTRAEDFGDSSDDRFTDAKFTARPVAKFSGNSQSLALEKGGSTSMLFDVTGYGYDVNTVSGSGASFSDVASFKRMGNSGEHSSVAAENQDARDHLITYEVAGVSTQNDEVVRLQFWEDGNLTPDTPKKRSVSDFNDLVVEVRATAIPLPAAVWAGAAVLGAAGLMRKRLSKLAGI